MSDAAAPNLSGSRALPDAPDIKPKLDGDGLMKRGLMLVIALYLVAALVLPLYVMLSKSLVVYSFDLSRYEVQVSDGVGQVLRQMG